MFLFDPRYETFEMFSLSHVLYILFFIVIISLLYIFKDRLKHRPKLDRCLRYMVAIYLLIFEWTFYIWAIASNHGVYDLGLLPLGLCAMSLYLTVMTLLFNSEKLFKILYPWAMSGALISLVVADMRFEFPHFRYIHFFGNHSLFMLAMLYLIWVRGFKIQYKDILKSSLILLLIVIPVFGLNFLLDTNHLFLRRMPDGVDTLFLWMGYPLWVLAFMALIFILFNLWYLPFFFNKKAPK